MLNIEDFKEEMIKKDGGAFGVEVATHKVLECACYDCERCLFRGDCRRKRWDWLLSEKKEVFVITKLEYDILKYLSDNTIHMYIARNKNGNLYAFDVEPVKKNDALWSGRGIHGMVILNKLFQFVKWEDKEPTSIKDVLDNCEVIYDV